MKASLHNHRQAPRKMRLVATSLKGKRVSDALLTLSFMPKKAAEPLKKLIESAVANAKQQDTDLSPADLRIKSITVDQGITMVRYMPRAFGRASPIKRSASHVNVLLTPIGKKAAEKAVESEKKSVAKKRTAKKK